jgi:RNA polymerase sigma-70 factor (ECF subfamily)
VSDAGGASRERLDLSALFDSQQRRLLALTLRITGDFGLAEDALQQTFLRAHRLAGGFRGEAAPETWLYRIAANEALRLRAQQRSQRSSEREAAGRTQGRQGAGQQAEAADAAPAWRQEAEAALAALETLPEEQRLALVLLSVKELSGEEVAAMLGVPAATVYTRAFRARLALRRVLEGEGSAVSGSAVGDVPVSGPGLGPARSGV